jgi:hypothetical protein
MFSIFLLKLEVKKGDSAKLCGLNSLEKNIISDTSFAAYTFSSPHLPYVEDCLFEVLPQPGSSPSYLALIGRL